MAPKDQQIRLRRALISVYEKEAVYPLVVGLVALGVELYTTEGTSAFLRGRGIASKVLSELTGYGTLFGGRVKTLHPKVFGGILYRREKEADVKDAKAHAIPSFDLVVVDLYPFESALLAGESEEALLEKIDIGGIALLRAGAKNFKDVWTVCRSAQYSEVLSLLEEGKGCIGLGVRRAYAGEAFGLSSRYDSLIHGYLQGSAHTLRYGENPHQGAYFEGSLEGLFEQYQGKALSYNNVLDVDAGLRLLEEFRGEAAFVIIKHGIPCGVGVGETVEEAWEKAYAGDQLSAFGGVFVCKGEISEGIAARMSGLFFEVLLGVSYTGSALAVLQKQKRRILLRQKREVVWKKDRRSVLGGMLVQDADSGTAEWKVVTKRSPLPREMEDLRFVWKVVKHVRSNAIVLGGGGQILGCGSGQTSRIDAVRIALERARRGGFEVKRSVLASEAFFPFSDGVEVAYGAGIRLVVQPGGSRNDEEVIAYCDKHGIGMIFTGCRHFRH